MPKFAGPNRQPCRLDEFIVIGANGNTMIIQDAKSPEEAALWRARQVHGKYRRDRRTYVVTDGDCSWMYEVTCTGNPSEAVAKLVVGIDADEYQDIREFRMRRLTERRRPRDELHARRMKRERTNA